MLDPSGDILGYYDKIHLFDVDLAENAIYRESDTVAPEITPGSMILHCAKVGHTICYDLRFPVLFRDLAQGGAEILCCPAAFNEITGKAHWHVLNRARAIENTAFVVVPLCCRSYSRGGASYGHSLVISPWGEVSG